MGEATLSEKLAAHISNYQLQLIPPPVRETAKLHVLDSLGVLLAGTRLEPGRRSYDLAVSLTGPTGEITLPGTSSRVSLLDGVLATATAAHCGEMDDIHSGAGTCVGAMVIPALLALAERYGGSGARFFESTIAGYETTVRLGHTIRAPGLFTRGWWPSTLCGAMGVAAAGGRFLGWSGDRIANAIGIASLHAGGMLTGGAEGATARHLLFGRAAQNGLLALLAAEAGFTGPRHAFEDPRGFCLTTCQDPEWSYLEADGRFFLPEVASKPFPCARQLHAAVEAIIRLVQERPLAAATLEGIELELPTAVAGMMDRPGSAGNRAACLGSGQFVMAVTLLRGRMDLASFEDEFLQSDAVHSLMSKVVVRPAVDLDRYYPQSWPARVRLRIAGEETREEKVVVPKGEGRNPMSLAEIEEKFTSLADPVLGENNARGLMLEVQSLERSDSLRRLISLLVPPLC